MGIALRDQLKSDQEKIWEDFDSCLPGEVLHFTSKDSFKGILESQTIWCTDIRTVNDPREGDHGMDIIRRAVAKKPFSLPPNFQKFVRSHLFKGLFGLKDSYTVYIACFSVEPVSAGMWKQYADGGNGCAIVFDYSILAKGQDNGDKYALFRVLYDRESQIRKAELTSSCAVALCKSKRLESRDWNNYWFYEVPFALSICALRFKDQSYPEEKEIRLYVAGGDNVSPFTAPDGRERVAVSFPKEAIVRVERPQTSALSTGEIRSTLERYGYLDLPIVEK